MGRSCFEQLEPFSRREPVGRPDSGCLGQYPWAESVEPGAAIGVLIRDRHRRTQLAAVTEKRRDLHVNRRGHVLDVVGRVGFEKQDGSRPVGRQMEIGEEQGIARRDDTVGEEKAGVTVIGVEPVVLPRVVAKGDIGAIVRIQRAISRRCAVPDSSSPSGQPRKTTSAVPPSVRAAARCSVARVATS